MLIGSLIVELGVLALIGGVFGVVSGYWLASVLLPDVAASLRGLYGAEVAGQLRLSPWWWFSGIGLSLFGALLAGANSLLRAARLPLLAVADPQAWHQQHARWLRRQGWLAAMLALIALLALVWGDSLSSGFVLMAGLCWVLRWHCRWCSARCSINCLGAVVRCWVSGFLLIAANSYRH